MAQQGGVRRAVGTVPAATIYAAVVALTLGSPAAIAAASPRAVPRPARPPVAHQMTLGDAPAALRAAVRHIFGRPRVPASWSQQAELTASDGVSDDRFGEYVAVSSATVVVGASGHNYSTGAASVFTRT